jgi:hypothetical protein
MVNQGFHTSNQDVSPLCGKFRFAIVQWAFLTPGGGCGVLGKVNPISRFFEQKNGELLMEFNEKYNILK